MNTGELEPQWISFKYVHMPIFCYWCGVLNHDEKDCKIWVRSRGTLKKEEQQYGAWMRDFTGRFQVAHAVQNKSGQNMNSMAPHTEGPKTQLIEATVTGDVSSDEINDDGGTILRHDHGEVELQYNRTEREILATPIMFKEHLKDIDNNLSKFSQKDNSGTYQVDKSSMVSNDIGDIFQFQANTLNQVKAGTTRIDGLIQGVQRTTVGIGVDEECVGMENYTVKSVDTRG